MVSLDFPQPRLLHIEFGGISASGSSDSSSGGSGFGVAVDVGSVAVLLEARGRVTGTGVGIGAAATIFDASTADGFGDGAGVSSTVECLPLVQGGMERNSSNVRTRGLQHVQPVRVDARLSQNVPRYLTKQSLVQKAWIRENRGRTFLSFVELWRPWVVYALLIRICEHLPTSLVYTLLGLRHLCSRSLLSLGEREDSSAYACELGGLKETSLSNLVILR